CVRGRPGSCHCIYCHSFKRRHVCCVDQVFLSHKRVQQYHSPYNLYCHSYCFHVCGKYSCAPAKKCQTNFSLLLHLASWVFNCCFSRRSQIGNGSSYLLFRCLLHHYAWCIC